MLTGYAMKIELEGITPGYFGLHGEEERIVKCVGRLFYAWCDTIVTDLRGVSSISRGIFGDSACASTINVTVYACRA